MVEKQFGRSGAEAAPSQFDGVAVAAVFAISAICHTPTRERAREPSPGTVGTFHFLMSYFFLSFPVSPSRGGMRGTAQGING